MRPLPVTATSFPLNETDETLLLQHPLEEAASPSDREIDANQEHVMSAHDKNLFIEQERVRNVEGGGRDKWRRI
jgi:hypothetical protein